ncbi:MAG: hypothetical protein ABIH92_04640 [Nanoarchaeota archaeon]
MRKEYIYVEHQGEKIKTFERPELYDGKRLAETIKKIKLSGEATFSWLNFETHEYEKKKLTEKDYLIVEGFLLFCYPEIVEEIDYKFYLDLPGEVVIERRKKRLRHKSSDETFFKIGMQEYEKFGLRQKDVKGINVIDGLKSVDEICEEILGKVS